MGLPKASDCSVAARLAVSKDQLWHLVRTFPLQDEFSLLSAAKSEAIPIAPIAVIFLLRVKSEATPIRRKIPNENTSEFGQASLHSALGIVMGCLALKLRRRERVA